MVPTAEEVTQGMDFTGKVAIITGANTGIGKEAARVFALRNCHVILGSRSVEKGNQAKEDIIKSIGSEKAHLIEVMKLDLSRLDYVRDFVKRFEARSNKDLHFLINNAGVLVEGEKATLNEDGLEIHFAVNHLAHYLLTGLLIPYLEASKPSRVVFTSSHAHLVAPGEYNVDDYNLQTRGNLKEGFSYGYSHSKLYNCATAIEMNKRLKSKGITVNALHPGVVKTEIFRNITSTEEEVQKTVDSIADYAKSLGFNGEATIAQGAGSILYAAIGKDAEEGGVYISESKPFPFHERAHDVVQATKLFEISEKLTGVKI